MPPEPIAEATGAELADDEPPCHGIEPKATIAADLPGESSEDRQLTISRPRARGEAAEHLPPICLLGDPGESSRLTVRKIGLVEKLAPAVVKHVGQGA